MPCEAARLIECDYLLIIPALNNIWLELDNLVTDRAQSFCPFCSSHSRHRLYNHRCSSCMRIYKRMHLCGTKPFTDSLKPLRSNSKARAFGIIILWWIYGDLSSSFDVSIKSWFMYRIMKHHLEEVLVSTAPMNPLRIDVSAHYAAVCESQ